MATVLSISTCPKIKVGRGRVVTGTVSHFNGFVKQLWFDNAQAPIEPTDVHPFYSLDRNDWVRAKDLRINESVQTATGRSMLRRSKWRHGVHRVYNIEVEREHVYYAGSQHYLVHNECPTDDIADSASDGVRRWTHQSKTAMKRKKIGNRDVEVHTDERGPHIHLDRGTKGERYISLKGKTVEEVMQNLPKKLRKNDEIRKAANKAKKWWKDEMGE